MARRQSIKRARTLRRAMAAGGDSDLVTGQTLETFSSTCNGRTITTEFGNAVTFENVTAAQSLALTYNDITGSSITYTPPLGTRTVIYEFIYQTSGDPDTHNIHHTRFYLDGVEITDGRRTVGGNGNRQGPVVFKFPIHITGTLSNTTGDRDTWTSAVVMKMQGRDYADANEQTLHRTNHFDGAGTNVVVRPTLTITAIG